MSRISTTNRCALAALLLGACVPTPDDRTRRYAGDLRACEPTVTRQNQAPTRHEPGEFWDPGPYPAWNTHPGAGCNDNVVMPRAGSRTVTAITGDEYELEFYNLQLYVTYPAQTDPSVTGTADVADGEFGLIVFAHANNDTVCEIFESYYSLHDQWASWGWIVASVDGTPHNCDRGSRSNITLRADGMVAAVERMRELNDDPESRFYRKLDMSRIVFAGHSRGGGASFIAARQVDDVLGVITLQGIDLVAFSFGTNDATDLPTLGMTAGNDVDLHYPRVEPVEDRLGGPYAWVNITGGIHAYTADIVPLELDDRPGISRQNQHDVTELYTTAFLRSLIGDPAGHEVVYGLEGARLSQSASPHGVYQRWRPPGDIIMIDSFDRDDLSTNELGGTTTFDGFLRAEEVYTYRPESDSERGRFGASRSLLLSATGPAVYRTEFDPVDASETPLLQFRVKGPDFGIIAPHLEVVFEHEDGLYEVPLTEEHMGPIPLANRFQQVSVPLPAANVPLLSVELRIGGGSVMLDDLRLATPMP